MRFSTVVLIVAAFFTMAASAAAEIPWERSLASAKARALRERKPILMMHLFGRLDEEFT